MRWNGFSRSLFFAAVAAGGFPVFALFANPVLGRASALSLYLIGIAVLYVTGLTPRRSRRVAVVGIAAVLGFGVLLLAPSVGTTAAGAALIVGVCRSGVLYRSRRARALVAETCLLAGGLGLARFLAGPDTLQVAFLERLRAEGLEAIAFNFAAGNWITGEDYINYFPKTLEAYTYLGFHEYGWPHMNPDESETKSGCGFYHDLMTKIRQEYGDRHRIIMTEAGLARMYMHSTVHPQYDRP